MVVTPWGESHALRDRMLRPGPGTSPDEVAANQRERLFAAMVASVSTKGYEATRVADLVELSGVSSRTFYNLFSGKEACFVTMLEALFAATVEAISGRDDPAHEWEVRVREGYEAFAEVLAAQPAAAKVCLIEAYAAGPAVRELLDGSARQLEALTRSRLSESPERTEMPGELVSAHVGALQEIGRTRLREGSGVGLKALVPDLAALTLSYLPPPEPLKLTSRVPTFGPESTMAHDDVERALRAFAAVAAEVGYSRVTVHEVAKRGAMSPSTLQAIFPDKESALLAGVESVGGQLVNVGRAAFQRSPDWATGIRASIGSMLNYLASRPAMAHLLATEVYAGGVVAIRRRAEALKPLGALLAEGYNLAPQTPPLATEVIASAIGGLLHQRLRDSGPSALPGLAPACTYIVLSPFVGRHLACAAANNDGRGQEVIPVSAPQAGLQPTKWNLLLILSVQPASLEALASELNAPQATVAQLAEDLEREGLIEQSEGAWRARLKSRIIELDEWALLSQEEREEISTHIVRGIEEEVSRSLESGTFDRRLDRHLTRLGFAVDEAGWRELAQIQEAAINASREVQLQSLERLRASGEKGISGRLVQMLFELPDS